MTPEGIGLLHLANATGEASNRRGAPYLTHTTTRETLIAWLTWCDPNGCYSDDDCASQDIDAVTVNRGWELIDDLIGKDAVFYESSEGMLAEGWYAYVWDAPNAGPYATRAEALEKAAEHA